MHCSKPVLEEEKIDPAYRDSPYWFGYVLAKCYAENIDQTVIGLKNNRDILLTFQGVKGMRFQIYMAANMLYVGSVMCADGYFSTIAKSPKAASYFNITSQLPIELQEHIAIIWRKKTTEYMERNFHMPLDLDFQNYSTSRISPDEFDEGLIYFIIGAFSLRKQYINKSMLTKFFDYNDELLAHYSLTTANKSKPISHTNMHDPRLLCFIRDEEVAKHKGFEDLAEMRRYQWRNERKAWCLAGEDYWDSENESDDDDWPISSTGYIQDNTYKLLPGVSSEWQF